MNNKSKKVPSAPGPAAQKKKPAARPKDPAFVFQNALTLVKSTGRSASTLRDLRDNIAEVSENCIFRHTSQYFAKGRILEYTNDFAEWVGISLEEGALAEHLSNIDSFSFPTIEDLRQELLSVIDHYLQEFTEPRPAMPGNEFYFTETISFVFPAGLKARNLAEFYMAMKFLEIGSIYYHFFEARMRLAEGVEDFTKWLEDVVKAHDVVKRIRSIDPFMHNIERIRELIIEILEDELRIQMEVV